MEYPLVVGLEKAGIGYIERGPNRLWVNVVLKRDEETEETMALVVVAIAPDELTNSLHAITHGRVLFSAPISDLIEFAVPLSEEDKDNINEYS